MLQAKPLTEPIKLPFISCNVDFQEKYYLCITIANSLQRPTIFGNFFGIEKGLFDHIL